MNAPAALAKAPTNSTALAWVDPGHVDWPSPEPLIAQQEREPYPIDALPKGIRLAVEPVHQFVQAPVEMVACSALTALSLATQALVDVRRSTSLSGPVSLFVVTVAESGERKTSIDRFFLDPIREHETTSREASKGDEANFDAELNAWEARCEAIKNRLAVDTKAGKPIDDHKADLANTLRSKPASPLVPRLIYGDTTIEKLTRNLATVWPSAGIISSEGGAVLGGHSMNPDSAMRTMGAFNVLWDGGTLTVDRATTESFSVQGARLTIGIQVQPSVLSEFMRVGRGLSRGSGFLARFLFCNPVSTQGTRAFREATNSAAVDAFNTRLADLLNIAPDIDPDRGLRPTLLDLDPEAFVEWRNWHDLIERQLGMDGEFIDVRDVAAKAADNIARMAALFHVFEQGPSGAIAVQHVSGAARIVLWHLYESRNFLGAFAVPESDSLAAALDHWLRAYCRNTGVTEVPTRTVLQKGPYKLRARKDLDRAIAVLAEHGRAREERSGKNGQRKAIVINPELLTGSSQ